MSDLTPITVSTFVRADLERAWAAFTDPASVMRWNAASDDWHCPRAVNDLRAGGTYDYRMEARDGSHGFDMAGTFLEVTPPTRLRFLLGSEREVVVEFAREGDGTRVTETFTPESTHPREMQRDGWQAILDNYARVAEAG